MSIAHLITKPGPAITRTFSTLVLFICLSLLPAAVNAQGVFDGGAGTPGDPYQISTASQLDAIRDNLGSHFVLTSDIDLGGDNIGGDFYNAGAGWMPIGALATPFTGSLDGDGHIVSGLFINRPAMQSVGLFGSVDEGAISRIGLPDVEITGEALVGALAGELFEGSITESWSSGSVLAMDDSVGGLVGAVVDLFLESTVRDSYSTAEVQGESVVGGLVGEVLSFSLAVNIERSYAAGQVTATDPIGIAGGLIGLLTGFVGDSYWNLDLAGLPDPGIPGISGISTVDMQSPAFWDSTSWDFAGTWVQCAEANNSFPILAWDEPPVCSAVGGGVSLTFTSQPALAAVTETTVTVTLSASGIGDSVRVIAVAADSPAPTVAEVINGNHPDVRGTAPAKMDTTGAAQTATVTGLTAGTSYDF